MKLKQKFVQEKQLTDRPQLPKHTDSTPLLARLEHEYLFHNSNYDSRSNHHRKKSTDKENVHGMINSVPLLYPEHQPKNTIKIDNYQGKRFKTQTGFEPTLTSSRYEGFTTNERQRDRLKLHQSQEESEFQKQPHFRQEKLKRYESIELNSEGDRPLTFGLIKQNEPMKSSVEYREDRKLKNEVLDEISKFRKNQQGMLASKEYSANGGQDVLKCSNHPNKKAKYRLITDEIRFEDQSEEEMVYCSKCAINLLQQGFKVEELKKQVMNESNIMKRSKNFGHSRLQEMRKFEEKLYEVEEKLNEVLNRRPNFEQQILAIEKQKGQTESTYDLLIDMLKQMKVFELRKVQNKKEKKINECRNREQIFSDQLENVQCIRRELKQYRNKFIIMKEQQFQFLINSFINKIQGYGQEQPHQPIPHQSVTHKIQNILASLHKAAQQKMDNEMAHEEMIKNDEYIKSQIKKPFRTLFPQEQSEYENGEEEQFPNIMQVSQENDSPSFQRMRRKI